MALEAAIYQQDLFTHNNGINNNTNNNKDLYPLLLEAWPDNNDSFFHPSLKIQDSHHFHTLDYNTTSTYFLDNQLEFDWQSYYYHHGINNHDNNNNNMIPSIPIPIPDCSVINHDLPPLNNYDHECWGLFNSSSSPEEEVKVINNEGCVGMEMVPRPKQRRRSRAKKNQEEIETQRMSHIAVERNRRKQMNEYLNVMKSLMPDSYVQRGDQASIVGAAINFVKELEHNLKNLSAKKQMKENNNNDGSSSSSTSSLPFEDFFTFPQFSSIISNDGENDDEMKSGRRAIGGGGGQQLDHGGVQGGGGGGCADVEVTMVESHAHLKIRLRRSLKHLSKLVAGLHSLRLLILHLNVNTAHDGVVLYSFSLKVEDETKLSSVDEIARAVYLLLGRIQEETTS